jgi:site-specific DNA-methyltransferase (adenine-specific)
MNGNQNYNPDVLNCLANLSNDEVFTPPELANKMLDLLPQELFQNPSTTFLDPFTKSGVFLREIVKRLDRGLEKLIPNRQKRIDHILKNQVFGIAITELTSLLARRSVYCSKDASGKYSISKFPTSSGNILYKNIKHTWVNGKCKYCGASQVVYDRGSEAEQYAYMFIHTDNPKQFFPNMKFDVIVGNPPYQLDDGGNSASAKPIYHVFVEQAIKLNPQYLAIITPSRWFSGGKGLDRFREKMLNSQHISHLVDYQNAKDCFPGNSIGGGVSYFLWNSNHVGQCNVINIIGGISNSAVRPLNEYPVFIRYNESISIINKIKAKKEKNIVNLISSRNPYGFATNERGASYSKVNNIKLISSQGEGYVNINSITQGKDSINKYKVMIGRVTSEHAGEPDKSTGKYKVFSSMRILTPNEICTDSYVIGGVCDSISQAENFYNYLRTSFVRFLILQSLSSINLSREAYVLVPLQDFSHPWTDEMLYKKYSLTDDEIAFIESMIRPME